LDQKYKTSGVHARIPALPHELTDRITPIEKSIILCHLGVPDIKADEWLLTIDGMVENPAVLTFAQLKQFPFRELQSFHQCAGSPLDPEHPTQRICNVIWGGALLKDVLANSKVQPGARFLWSSGSDGGVSVSSLLEPIAPATSLGRRQLRKQFCASLAQASFHTAWVRLGPGHSES
jgi:DMSO/TMAO reductase YedYZ molybdopterin-dependent catalytic subunit